jgi:hypothetical protein
MVPAANGGAMSMMQVQVRGGPLEARGGGGGGGGGGRGGGAG